jgi:hypothetical protein
VVTASEWVTRPVDAFKVSSPWSKEDRLPTRPDTSKAVTCTTCGKRFIDPGWLDKHVDEGHAVPQPDRDIEHALTPAPGRMPSPWQNLARRVLEQLASYAPGDEVLIKTFVNENAPWLAQKAFAHLIDYGVLCKTGTARHARYWVPGPGVPGPGAR